MCIVALAWKITAEYPMVLLSNRDEFYARPATQLVEWSDSDIIAGQDVQSHGTWLGMTKRGRWAVITNFRETPNPQPHQRSRGLLVTDYLNAHSSPMQFAKQLYQQSAVQQYAGFNLIVGDREQAVLVSNRGTAPTVLASGLYTLSNGLISDSWPKMEKLRLKVMQEFLPLLNYKSQKTELSEDKIQVAWDILQQQQQAEDADLPHTGIPMVWEKALSSIFIQLPTYGTRVSNLMLLDQMGYAFIEKTHVPELGEDEHRSTRAHEKFCSARSDDSPKKAVVKKWGYWLDK